MSISTRRKFTQAQLDKLREQRAGGAKYKELSAKWQMPITTLFNYINFGLPYKRKITYKHYDDAKKIFYRHYVDGLEYKTIANEIGTTYRLMMKWLEMFKELYPYEYKELKAKWNAFECGDCKLAKAMPNRWYRCIVKNKRVMKTYKPCLLFDCKNRL